MRLISKHHQFSNITLEELLAKFADSAAIFLPPSIRNQSLNHYWESTGNRFGFELDPPWEALPAGVWKISVELKEQDIAEASTYSVQVMSGQEKIYTGDLKIKFKTVESNMVIDLVVDGKREAGLETYSDDLIETIIRSLIRESWAYLEQLISSNSLEEPADEYLNPDHMAPLAVAAGVFSAGMALGLWFWRRKRKS